MGFEIGPITIRYYGIILMMGAIAASILSTIEAKRKGEDPEKVWDGLTWVLIGGIIGARLWHIFTPPPSMVSRGITTLYYLTHPLDALAIWRGGLGIPGAVIGGGLALYWFTRRNKLQFAVWSDMIAPGLALGQAIGRWGNFVNQELYGRPTNLPWGIFIEPQYRLPEFSGVTHYHPLFLYESIWNFGNMVFLLWLGRKYNKKLSPGTVFLSYLITYPLGRFMLEFLRLDPARYGRINVNQTFMAIVIFIASILVIHKNRTAKHQV